MAPSTNLVVSNCHTQKNAVLIVNWRKIFTALTIYPAISVEHRNSIATTITHCAATIVTFAMRVLRRPTLQPVETVKSDTELITFTISEMFALIAVAKRTEIWKMDYSLVASCQESKDGMSSGYNHQVKFWKCSRFSAWIMSLIKRHTKENVSKWKN